MSKGTKSKAQSQRSNAMPAPTVNVNDIPPDLRVSYQWSVLPDTITIFRGHHAFLSNFYVSPITTYDPVLKCLVTYPTVEHYYQAHKASDPAERKFIIASSTPVDARRLGRSVTKLVAHWDRYKFDVMRHGVTLKFDQHQKLAKLLAMTGTSGLVHLTTWGDQLWGTTQAHSNPMNTTGWNLLGVLLMKKRAEFFNKALRHENLIQGRATDSDGNLIPPPPPTISKPTLKTTIVKPMSEFNDLQHDDVYVGRLSAEPHGRGMWGNPFSHRDIPKRRKWTGNADVMSPESIKLLSQGDYYVKVDTVEEAVFRYREYLMRNPVLLAEVHHLAGRTLRCWCKDWPCHAYVIGEIAETMALLQS
jgi:ribA/ribD-fused uncharacterized protein